MLQVRIHGPGDVRVDDVAEPEPGPADVLVRVTACGVCGSDLSYIRMGGLAGPTGEPMCLGHEMAGVVDWVGPQVSGSRVGDRVVVQPGSDELGRIGNGAPQGGLTPLLLVTGADRGRLHPVPDALPLDVAAFAEPLAVGMHAADQADVRPRRRRRCLRMRSHRARRRGHPGRPWPRTGRRRRPDPTRRGLALGLGAQAALDPTTTDVWEELGRLHGTSPACSDRRRLPPPTSRRPGRPGVISEVLDHGSGRRPSVGRGTPLRAGPHQLPDAADEAVHHPRIAGVPVRDSPTPSTCSAAATCRRSSPIGSRSPGSPMPWPCSKAPPAAARSW